ncbi:unnamed protein product [Soboliphyme baturini]|uniref:Uncharacterized protein n=1 Tax=Soboliphyme baturini TaxID=241478 RepID=A0A183IVH0_9BILA|nr:unnamed protein product [Soboliphyme baturini]
MESLIPPPQQSPPPPPSTQWFAAPADGGDERCRRSVGVQTDGLLCTMSDSWQQIMAATAAITSKCRLHNNKGRCVRHASLKL